MYETLYCFIHGVIIKFLKQTNMNVLSISEKEIINVIELISNGEYSTEVAKKTGISYTTCCKIWNYYSGKNNETSKVLAKKHKDIIDNIKNRKNNKKQIKHYECTLFFGLIKLKFNPVY